MVTLRPTWPKAAAPNAAMGLRFQIQEHLRGVGDLRR
jgi:hypothetical protein